MPDFLIIGTMKSGSTTLFNWLGCHPRVQLPAVKEPGYFSDARRFGHDVQAYTRLFEGVAPDCLTGEASVIYTDPLLAGLSATNVSQTVPGVALICLLRDPVARMRSHYRHQVQRGRERKTFAEAVTPESEYVRRSCYAASLGPWLDLFPREQFFFATFESFFGSDDEWTELLAWLGLEAATRPTTAFNVTAEKRPYSPLMRVLWDAGVIQRVPPLPRPVRRALRPFLLRRPEDTEPLVRSSADAPTDAVRERLARDLTELERLLPDVAVALRRGWRG